MGRTKDLSRKFATRILKLAVSMAAVVLMAGLFVIQTQAASAKVTASSVKIREQASTSSEVVGSAAYGDSFEIKEEVTAADGYVWYKVQVDANKVGYIRSDLTEKSGEGSTGTTTPSVSTDGVTNIQPISAKVTGNLVRVRPDASTNGSVVTTVEKDTTVAVNGVADGADNKTWYLVSFQTGSGEVTGFIREDFLALAGDVVPVTETEDPGAVEEPADIEEPEDTVTTKDYETFEEEGVWYLVNNTTDPAYQYKINEIFDAAETNAELYNNSLKTIKTQKIFIVILVLLLIGGGVAATLLIFKMKDMLDESYFAEIEKETVTKRQNKQQNVMHTVGTESVQKKPTVNGQQKTVAKPQQTGGQPKQMPKQQIGDMPKPNMTAAGGQGLPKQAAQSKVQQKPQGQATQAKPQQQVKPQQNAQAKPQNQPMQAKPQVSQATAQNVKSADNQVKASANVQQDKNQQNKQANAKTNPEWKSKNFMTEDDDFEFEFLNWDGDDDL